MADNIVCISALCTEWVLTWKALLFLNLVAFVKILKEFDKVPVTTKEGHTIYLKVVGSSYLNSSDKVNG